MIAQLSVKPKDHLKKYAVNTIDYLWNASIVITILFGASVLLLFGMGLMISSGLIKPPPQLCHYMVENIHIEDFCKQTPE